MVYKYGFISNYRSESSTFALIGFMGVKRTLHNNTHARLNNPRCLIKHLYDLSAGTAVQLTVTLRVPHDNRWPRNVANGTVRVT